MRRKARETISNIYTNTLDNLNEQNLNGLIPSCKSAISCHEETGLLDDEVDDANPENFLAPI